MNRDRGKGDRSPVDDLSVLVISRKISQIITVKRKFGGIHQFQFLGQLRKAEVGAELQAETTGLSFLRRDDDDTVTAARTIDGCRRSVLQHIDRLNITRADVVQVVHGINHTIDYDQRFVAG